MNRRTDPTTSLTSPRSRRPHTLIHWFSWRHVRCKLTESRNTPYSGTTQLELVPIAARDVPVPLAENGYRAFIVDSTVLADAGGPVAYVTDAMAERATARDYRRAEFLWRQGNLFDRLPDEEPEV